MNLGKKTILLKPKPCYLLFELNEEFTNPMSNVIQGTYKPTLLYNGELQIFTSLRDLNNKLSKTTLTDTIKDIDNKLYKGSLFPGSEFPATKECEDDNVFIIEKIDTSTCYLEEKESLSIIAETIEEEMTILKSSITDDMSITSITDYMIFIGKKMKLSYYCYDSENNHDT